MTPLSRTRTLISALRRRLGEDDPMPPPPALQPVPPPPVRVFPTAHRRSRYAALAEAHTTALVGIGAVGTRYATDVVLQFQAELAVAHEAVHTVLPEDWAEGAGCLPVQSRVGDHHEFLLRPDLGRRLDAESVERVGKMAKHGVDVQPILADGLSAVACMGAGTELLTAFTQACLARGLSVGTPICARFARVWLEDEIGELVGAKVAAILLGERPGLGTGDGLSAYLVFDPKVGRTDGDRNMMSNIHARGTPPQEAGVRLASLAGGMIEQGRSGVALDLAALDADAAAAASTAYRAPQKRQRLVEWEAR